MLLFNPQARVQVHPVGRQQACYVVDNALLNPEACVQHAVRWRDRFVESPYDAFPGLGLPLNDAEAAPLDDFFAARIRRRLHGRRTLHHQVRLSMVTHAPEQLAARQRLCHVDRLDVDPGQCLAASVLYLFDDSALGGTSFFMPRRPMPEIVALVQDSARLPADEFNRRYDIAPGYMTGSNHWFAKVAEVPARFNRLIFYSGSIFHSGSITAPEKLSADPERGRLTLNGFFVCRRSLA